MCVCVMSAHLSLSPLLHFVPKFSIQKIKGGEKKASERAAKGKEEGTKKERKVSSWISFLTLCQSRNDIRPKKATASEFFFKKNTFILNIKAETRHLVFT